MPFEALLTTRMQHVTLDVGMKRSRLLGGENNLRSDSMNMVLRIFGNALVTGLTFGFLALLAGGFLSLADDGDCSLSTVWPFGAIGFLAGMALTLFINIVLLRQGRLEDVPWKCTVATLIDNMLDAFPF